MSIWLTRFFQRRSLQLAEQLPGLIKTEVSRVTAKPGGQSRFLMMYEMYFDSAETFHAALLTEPGLELIAALKPWSDKKLITWFYADTFEEESGVWKDIVAAEVIYPTEETSHDE